MKSFRLNAIFGVMAAVMVCGIVGCSALGDTHAWPEATKGEPTAHFGRGVIDTTLKSLVTENKVLGVSLLVFKDDREVYFGAYGDADREAKRPMARDTIVQIFSMTKPMTGTTLMSLYDEGRIYLDKPIGTYLPEMANLKVFAGLGADGKPELVAPSRQPTLRDFTRHSAGLTDRSGKTPFVDDTFANLDPMSREHTLAEMAARMGQVPLLYQPGTRWLYGDSVDIQAAVIERIVGKPFAEVLNDRVIKPLGLKDTGYFVPPEKRRRLAAMYTRKDDGTFIRQPEDPGAGMFARHADGTFARKPDEPGTAMVTSHWPLTPGGWGLASTLDDYMTFARMLLNDGKLGDTRIISAKAARLMHTNQLDDSVTNRSWLPNKGQVGFGINMAVRLRPPADPQENPGVVGEYFWDGAASTLFWIDPANDMVAVLFVQLMPFDKVGLHHAVRHAVYTACGCLQGAR